MFLFENADSMILYHLTLILFSNIFFALVGLLSQSRYAIIAIARSLIHVISLDIFITIIYTLLIFSSQSAHFHEFVLTQNLYWFFFLYSPIASGFVILLILESKRTPFDHAETEAEVVAGYATEYSGPMLLIFFFVWIFTLNNCWSSFRCIFLRWVVRVRVFLVFTTHFFIRTWCFFLLRFTLPSS